ncbi:MAG: ABC transporter ATP-binding protein [Desulfomonilaceae bacterium]
MPETALLQVEKLSKSFGKFQAIADVSLSVKTGTLSALIGPNGAGKTTFYNVVTGRYRPSQGHIFFEGTDVTRAPTHKLVARGLLRSFQITNIFPALSVMENVIAPLIIQHHSSFSFLESLGKREDFVEEGRTILERVGLADKAARIASTLAYGDKRLVEIAIVLARRPKLVLLDEPTAGMTPQETDRMIHLIKDLAEQSGTTFFITEHDMKVVFAVAERIFVLHQGRLLAEGLPEEIRSNRTVKEAYLGGSLDASDH